MEKKHGKQKEFYYNGHWIYNDREATLEYNCVNNMIEGEYLIFRNNGGIAQKDYYVNNIIKYSI